MVGAVLVKKGQVIGQGWHHQAGKPHAEIEALRNAERRGQSPRGATLYVTLEPCCTHGRTPPCTEALIAAGVARVVVAATDPNPAHAGRGFRLLKRAGIAVTRGVLAMDARRLNEAFNHWIVHRTPFDTLKSAMTLDGKIATAAGESKWITGEKARAIGMKLRQGSDAILVGINTAMSDDPSLTVRGVPGSKSKIQASKLRRIILDSRARTPLNVKVVVDEHAALTTLVVGPQAPPRQVAALAKRVRVLAAPSYEGHVDLLWLMRELGRENVTSLLVEGGGEVHASFLARGLAHRIAFFYAPKILGDRDARKAVGGDVSFDPPLRLEQVEWRRVGDDLFLNALIQLPKSQLA
jgi:diaminohydroxyphosphoribosylaminopyrimidine deaminase/5-amino-6-(5-phosphoribosylamino)uracil reductase